MALLAMTDHGAVLLWGRPRVAARLVCHLCPSCIGPSPRGAVWPESRGGRGKDGGSIAPTPPLAAPPAPVPSKRFTASAVGTAEICRFVKDVLQIEEGE